MTDDLVKRLRSPKNVFYEYATDDGAFLREAADRIEELEEQRKKTYESMLKLTRLHDEVEAKLATCEKYRDAYAEMDRIGTQAVRELEAKIAKVVAEAATHFAVYSATGVHVGLWTEHKIAADVLGDYPGGSILHLRALAQKEGE